MTPPELTSMGLQTLDCATRMFLVSLCLTDEDLQRIGFLPEGVAPSVRRATAARSALHRLCALELPLARTVADLLDLRYIDRVQHVRAHEASDLQGEAQCVSAGGDGVELAGWAWALLTDPREEIRQLARQLMGEAYVRGMRLLGSSVADRRRR